MKQFLIPLAIAILFACNPDAWSQQGPPGGRKGPPGGGQGGPPGGKGGPPGGGQRGGQPGGGQKGGPPGGGQARNQPARSTSYPRISRSQTPLQKIRSALSLIRLKRELRAEHYAKLSSSLAAAAGVSTVSEPLERLSRTVADMVSKYRLGSSDYRNLAKVLHDAVQPQLLSAERLNMTVKYTRESFNKTEATPEELDLVEDSLREYKTRVPLFDPQ